MLPNWLTQVEPLVLGIVLLAFAMVSKQKPRASEQLRARPLEELWLFGAMFAAVHFVVTGPLAAMRNELSLGARTVGSLSAGFLFAAILVAFQRSGLSIFSARMVQDECQPEVQSRSEHIFWCSLGVGLFAAAVVVLEWRQPFYFSQDDNLAVNLPQVIYGCRSAFAGVFPTWNPHLFMGSPTTSLGYYALTYPPTYFSYWLARTVLGNENCTLEVFAVFHLMLSYLVIYKAIVNEGCRAWIAMLGGLCAVLSGYALIFSRSWYQFSAVLLWTGLMTLCVQWFARGGRGWKWIATFGIVVGVAFHAGHVQMWVYSVLMADFAMALLMWSKAVEWRRVLTVIAAHLVALAIAAPLLVPEMIATRSAVRQFLDPRGIAPGLWNLFVPSSVIAGQHPVGWGGFDWNRIGEMYYSGTLFIVICAMMMLSLLTRRWSRDEVRVNVWMLCAVVAFVFALGSDGLLWTAMAELPGFDRFRYPFKFLAYIVLFSSIGGAVGLERFLRRGAERRWNWAAVAVVLVLLAYHVQLSTAAFYSYQFKPFPRPDNEIAKRLARSDVRMTKFWPIGDLSNNGFLYGGFRSQDPHFIDSYMNEWPAVVGGYSIGGYNPLLARDAGVKLMEEKLASDRTRALHEYGVEYVLQYDALDNSPPMRVEHFEGEQVAYRSRHVLLHRLPTPRPMAFLAGSEDPLAVMFDGAGADVEVATHSDSELILNMLWKTEMVARVDGHAASVRADDWGRIAVAIPANARSVRIEYVPEWRTGFMVSLAAFGAALIVGSFEGWFARWFATRAASRA